MSRYWPVSVFVVLIFCGPVLATSTSTLVLDQYSDLLKGSGPGVVVRSPGVLLVGPKAAQLAETSESQVWDLAELPDGAVLVGTGHEGKILKIAPDGQVTTFFNSPELEIHSLAIGPDGEVYAGSAPDGLIYRIEADGSASTWYDTKQTYVWDLVFFQEHLYAATGPEGKLFRVDIAGEGVEVLDSTETHLTALAVAGSHLLAGGGSEGRLYQIEGEKARVLFDGPEIQVVGIVQSALTGVVVFASSSGEAPAPAAGAPATEPSKTPNRLYRLEEGVVQPIWEAPVTPIYAIARRGDQIAVSAGEKGQIFLVSTEGAQVQSWLDGPQLPIADLLESARGTLLGTGGTATVHLLGNDAEPQARYLSDGLDLGRASRLGQVWWSGSGAIEVRARTGNSQKPDATWSDWGEPVRDPQGALLGVPSARFVQLEVLLAEPGSRLERLELAYLAPNLAPTIQDLTVHPAARGVFLQDPPQPQKVFTQQLPGGINLRYTLMSPDEQTRDGAGNWMRIAGMRTLSWRAQDPNRDDLLYDVSLVGEEIGPILLARDATDPFYTFDTTAFADGRYRIRLVASDRASNPPLLLKEASLDSELFTIDNQPPRVQRLSVARAASGGWDVEASVTDETGRIGGAEYTLDGKAKIQLFPADQVFDSSTETFFFHVETDQSPGRLLLHVYDRDMNRASVQTLLQPEP